MTGLAGRPIIACLAALVAASGPCPGQPQPPEGASPAEAGGLGALAAADRPMMHVDFGYPPTLVTERWNPVTVWVASGDRAASGVIEIEHMLDATQMGRTTAPFATTPGRVVPVTLYIPIAEFTNRLTVRLFDQSGRRLSEQRFNAYPGERELQLPAASAASVGLLLILGDTSVPDAHRWWSTVVPTGQRGPDAGGEDDSGPNKAGPDKAGPDEVGSDESIVEDPGEVTIDSGAAPRIPSMPAGLDGRVDPEQTANAMATWGTSGAWAALLTSRLDSATAPRTWIGYDRALAVIVHADAAATIDPRVMAAIHEWVFAGGRLVIVADDPGSGWKAAAPPPVAGYIDLPDPIVGPAPAVLAELLARESETKDSGVPLTPNPAAARRAIALTPAGKSAGWSGRWPTDGGAPLLAEGPHGAGWVSVLGLDPGAVATVVSSQAAGVAWKDALEPVIGDWIAREAANPTPDAGRWQWSVYTPAERTARAAVLDDLVRFAPPGNGSFVVIAVAMLLLAVILGPGDALILRRLGLRHRSWLTAIGWIAAASVAAYSAPRLVRSGDTSISRVTVTDAVQNPDGPTRAARSGVTSIFAGAYGRIRNESPDPASWWRGLSASNWSWSSDTMSATAPVELAQSPGDPDRGSPVTEFISALWTLRYFADESIGDLPIRAVVLADERGPATVVVSGLPEGATIVDAAVRADGVWRAVGSWTEAPPEVRPPLSSALSATVMAPVLAAAPGESWEIIPRSDPGFDIRRSSGPIQPRTAAMMQHGPLRRGHTLDRLSAMEGWAVVALEIRGLPRDVVLGPGTEAHRRDVVRLAVPVVPGGAR